ncbi:class I SAM-dependent methyltransferase [Salinicoccus carnicancri]|uniref:class I SAM-dependent methyltransferase n=1 Tax=Salinicoccus carnicancri TaxID=558170 RepID=UPI0002EF4380|nr:methyltransferase [Salinicoccus carnicancri]
MAHYFTNDDTEHDFREIEYVHAGRTYRFTTDRGVFSRERIDFGSRVLIEAVITDFNGVEHAQFIDMGAGYGPIGIIAGDALGMKPVMVEVNEDAVRLCARNAETNDVQAEVLTRAEYDADSAFSDVGLYVTNPPFRAGKKVVMGIIDDASEKLSPGGIFYMVVQKKQGMPSYRKAMEASFGDAVSIHNEKGYHVLKGVKNH